MASITIMQIEEAVANLVKKYGPNGAKGDFIYEMIFAYVGKKSTIKLLKDGKANLSKKSGEISWKKKLFYKEFSKGELNAQVALDTADSLKHDERFVVLTDGSELYCVDTKIGDTLNIKFKELTKRYAFFLPWAGIEKTEFLNENPADVKAARKMAQLFDEIKKDNRKNAIDPHDLNVFLSRLLFCYFAEDTEIFTENQFTNAVASITSADGSDLSEFIDRLFDVLDTPKEKRRKLPDYLESFPYVNGGLFRKKIIIPKFSAHSRNKLIECGELSWKDINPDIFGSMFQTVIDEKQRSDLGQHYTSVPNIMKILNPLLLDSLNEELDLAGNNQRMLKKLLTRIRRIKIFDPACGSGNFLIIAYKELRRLEVEILSRLDELAMTEIHLDHFYGIECDDFACETAKLSLWLAEHQMNAEIYQKTGTLNATLPLEDAGHIVKGNACCLDWNRVCPKENGEEVYVLGNPPYLGARLQKDSHKKDVEAVLGHIKNSKNLDYIACWFYKGAEYIRNSMASMAFVSTNSICQGEQVAILWPNIFKKDVEIQFAYSSFKWTNNAQKNAGVIVTIIGLCDKKQGKDKFLINDEKKAKVPNINAYLTTGSEIVVKGEKNALNQFPPMKFGSMPNDGGFLTFNQAEYDDFVKNYPNSKKFIKKFIGSEELIGGISRYCIWITEKNKDDALKIEGLKQRVLKCKEHRKKSSRKSTNKLALVPYQFGEVRYKDSQSIIVPGVSSERRLYIPMDILPIGTVVSNAAFAVYDAEPWIFSVLNSRMHMVWARSIGGRLKNDYRYSAQLVYNTFPFPDTSDKQKDLLQKYAFGIIGARANHVGKTLAYLYNPETMPGDLKLAHEDNDVAVESLYRSKPFTSDEERLAFLLKLYEKMVNEKAEQGSLFEKKKRK